MIKVRDDLSGKIFGNFLVLEQSDDYVSPKGCHRSQWKCRCLLCGNEDVVIMDTVLKKGTKQSCGCIEDLTNKKFGRLTVILRDGKDKDGNTLWKCRCDCGNFISITHHRLIIGDVKSCGCLRKDFAKEKFSKLNRYDLSGDFGIGWTSNTNKEFYFDLEDYDKIKDYCWYEDKQNSGYHCLRAKDRDTGKIIKFQYLLGCKNYDHKNRNPLDNRKLNLRPATAKQNARNRSLSTLNTSGFIGVYFDKDSKKWRAYIKINGKNKWLGRFIDKEDAIVARLKAEKEYFGEFAPQRNLFKEYGLEDKFLEEE